MFLQIGAGCSKLEELRINQCTRLNNDGVTAIAWGCPNLHTFVADECSQVIYIHVYYSYKKSTLLIFLENLHFFVHIYSLSIHMAKCMSCLNILSFGFSILNIQVGDEAVHELASHCHELKFLNLMGTIVSEQGIMELVKVCMIINILGISFNL